MRHVGQQRLVCVVDKGRNDKHWQATGCLWYAVVLTNNRLLVLGRNDKGHQATGCLCYTVSLTSLMRGEIKSLYLGVLPPPLLILCH